MWRDAVVSVTRSIKSVVFFIVVVFVVIVVVVFVVIVIVVVVVIGVSLAVGDNRRVSETSLVANHLASGTGVLALSVTGIVIIWFVIYAVMPHCCWHFCWLW